MPFSSTRWIFVPIILLWLPGTATGQPHSHAPERNEQADRKSAVAQAQDSQPHAKVDQATEQANKESADASAQEKQAQAVKQKADHELAQAKEETKQANKESTDAQAEEAHAEAVKQKADVKTEQAEEEFGQQSPELQAQAVKEKADHELARAKGEATQANKVSADAHAQESHAQGTKQKADQELAQAKHQSATALAEASSAEAAMQKAKQQMRQARNVSGFAAALESKAQATMQKSDQEMMSANKGADDAAALESRTQAAIQKSDQQMERAKKEAAEAAALAARTQAAEQTSAQRMERAKKVAAEAALQEQKNEAAREKAGDKIDDSTDLGVAIMLLGSISFMMCVFYLVNHSDDNIQRYSWKVVSSTISIFSAVLMFQACNKNVENFVLQGKSCWYVFCVDIMQLAFWVAIMQVVLFFICSSSKQNGAMGLEDGTDNWQGQVRGMDARGLDAQGLDARGPAVASGMDKFEENIKSYGILLAHISGFAAVNAWGTLQQIVVHHIGLEQVHEQQIAALGVVFLAAFVMWLVLKVTSRARYRLYMADGETDEFEEKENELAKETEHDVVGITISFSLVQVVRFVFDGRMPNVEGVYKIEDDTVQPFRHVLFLLASSIVFALCVVNRPASFLMGRSAKRVRACLKITWSTSFAWSLYFANYWLVRVLFGQESGKMMATLTVVLALVCTSVAFFLIFGLEKLEEALQGGAGGGELDRSVHALILSLAVLVGFSWERSFDVSLDLIAERLSSTMLEGSHDSTGLVVFALACILCAVVLPAWKWFILPMDLKLERAHQERKAMEEDELTLTPRSALSSSSARNQPGRARPLLPQGKNGEYVRLPGTPPPRSRDTSPSRSSSTALQLPRSPRLAANMLVAPDIAMLHQRAEVLASQVASLRNLRLAAWPQMQGADVAVKCSEWLAKLEMEAGSLSLKLVDSKMFIEDQFAHQAQLEKDVLGMRMELHAAYLQFWGTPEAGGFNHLQNQVNQRFGTSEAGGFDRLQNQANQRFGY